MKTIETTIAWTSNEYGDTPKKVRFELYDKDLAKIELCKKLIKEHDLDTIRISVCADLFDEENEESDWRAGTMSLNITAYGIYFYAQNKWDSGDQIGSECIDELFKTK